MSTFTQDQLDEIAGIVSARIDETVKLLLSALEIDHDPAPLLEGFKTKWTVGKEMRQATYGWNVNNAVCLLRAAKLAYRDPAYVRLELRRCAPDKNICIFENTMTNTQGFAILDGRAIILAFRGTETRSLSSQVADLVTDVNIRKVGFIYGNVHRGFLEALDSVWPQIEHFLQSVKISEENKVWITGHSLGGAIATLAAARIASTGDWGPKVIGGLYTIGQPLTGDAQFASAFNSIMGIRTVRIARSFDPITMVPPAFLGYRHSGGLRYIQRDGMFRFIKSRGGIMNDRIKAIFCYISATFLKILATWFLAKLNIDAGFSYASVVAHHDVNEYLRSIRDARSRKDNDG